MVTSTVLTLVEYAPQEKNTEQCCTYKVEMLQNIKDQLNQNLWEIA